MNSELNRLSAKHGDADEVFVPVGSKEEAQRVVNFNDTQGKVVMKQRQNLIKKQGEVRDGEFADRKLQLHTQARQEMLQKMRGK